MITPGSVNPLLMAGGRETTPCGGSVSVPSYVIKNSLRFRNSGSTQLSRTPTIQGNIAKYTFSTWLKLSNFDNLGIFESYSSATHMTSLHIEGGELYFQIYRGNPGRNHNWVMRARLRDPSAWYHLVVAIDTNLTSDLACTMYLNGVVQPLNLLDVGGTKYVAGANQGLINGLLQHFVGLYSVPSHYFSGYMADVHFIDGQALDANSFGEFDSNNVWRPKAYAGTYGTNGFWLKFDDAAQIGKDSSGNNNHWTANNIDVAAPGTQATYDLMKDSPVMFDDGTANPPGNYATLNPLDAGAARCGNGNLSFDTSGNYYVSRSTISIPSSGKYYFEGSCSTATSAAVATSLGICTSSAPLLGENIVAGIWGYYTSVGNTVGGGYVQNNGVKVATAIGATSPTDVVQIVLDMDKRVGWAGRNGVWWDGSGGTTGNPATGANPSFTNLPDNLFAWVSGYSNITYVNFGQRPFKYAPPAGFKALCTTNLPYCQPFDKPDGTAPHNATVTLAANEFKYLGYVPTVATGVTWGTQLDKLANGVKAHTAGTYTITNSGERFKTGLAQGNP